ncbi:MAG: DUF6175 family protein [bacterium]|nr:DUF6175 family protein [bacterium]
MRSVLKYVLVVLIAASFLTPNAMAQGNLPQSRQASFVESYSPTEWMIQAAGIGTGSKKEQEVNAINDAKKSALYFCLYMGTDPILTAPEEKSRFALQEQNFFDLNNVNKYIAWEAQDFTLRAKMADGKSLKIEKVFRVNVGLLKEDLVTLGVIVAGTDLAAELGLPQILVLPEVPKGGNPLEALDNQSELKQAARSIESYLTARRYEVIVPEQQDFLNNYGSTMKLIKGAGDDVSLQVAQSIGSDVYVTYTVSIATGMQGSTETRKASVTVRAFETTTGRLLGTETGYSYDRPAPPEVVTEEAIKDAIDKVLSRVMAYWKDDLQKGIQYKVIFNITGTFDQDQLEDLQFAVADAVKSCSNRSKENVATDQTLDYLLWAKADKYQQARDLYRDIKTAFSGKYANAKIKQQQLNRKLIMLEITN